MPPLRVVPVLFWRRPSTMISTLSDSMPRMEIEPVSPPDDIHAFHPAQRVGQGIDGLLFQFLGSDDCHAGRGILNFLGIPRSGHDDFGCFNGFLGVCGSPETGSPCGNAEQRGQKGRQAAYAGRLS